MIGEKRKGSIKRSYLKLIILGTMIMLLVSSFQVNAYTSVKKPEKFKITLGNKSVKLTWKSSPGAKYYQIYQRDTGVSNYKKVKKVTGTSYTFKNLRCGKKYYFKVRAYALSGKKTIRSSMTAGIAAVPRPVVGTPSGVGVNMVNNKISIKWKKVSGATGYEIYYAIGSKDNYQLLERTSKNQKVLSSFKKNKTYYFKIRAREVVNGTVFKGKFSKQISVKTTIKKSKSVSTIKKLLKAAMLPVGKTMYVWGGGWNKEDTGSGVEAVTMGVSPAWEKFFNKQDSSYNYDNTRYQIHNGLDCSGYIGWCIYNALNTTNGKEGYVMGAGEMAANYASKGWGTYIGKNRVRDYKPGDIMSSDCTDCAHVWIVVGQCSDGSVVLVHSSPAGVQLNGTVNRYGSQNSEAVKLATYYMKKKFPKWYKKFPNCTRGESYLSHYAQMRWDVSGKSVLNDPEGYQKKNAAEVLQDLF